MSPVPGSHGTSLAALLRGTWWPSSGFPTALIPSRTLSDITGISQSSVSEIISQVSTALGVIISYSYTFPQEQRSRSHRCQQILPLMLAGCNGPFFLIGANNNNTIQSLPAPFLLLSG